MSRPEMLLQAALNRLVARAGDQALEAAAQLSLLAQDAPQRVQQELQLFWDEVQQEAERLERDQQPGAAAPAGPSDGDGDPQRQIDGLRRQVAELTRRLEEQP
jgi:uncharacterized protein YceH (UPF0502 family)